MLQGRTATGLIATTRHRPRRLRKGLYQTESLPRRRDETPRIASERSQPRVALIDRLTRHAEIVFLEAHGFRRREADSVIRSATVSARVVVRQENHRALHLVDETGRSLSKTAALQDRQHACRPPFIQSPSLRERDEPVLGEGNGQCDSPREWLRDPAVRCLGDRLVGTLNGGTSTPGSATDGGIRPGGPSRRAYQAGWRVWTAVTR